MTDAPRPYALPGILGEIARLTCEEVAIEIARRWGGVRLYIPTSLGRDHRLAKLIGVKAAKLLAASSLGGARHDIPVARNFLHAREAVRLYLDERMGHQEIALKLGITYRQVGHLLEGVVRSDPSRPSPSPPVPERCPFCGRRRIIVRRPDPRQMALPMGTEE